MHVRSSICFKARSALRVWMKPIPDNLEKKKDSEGISNKKHIEKNLAKFLYLIENQDTRSARMCVETIEMIRDQIDDDQKKPRIPQVIPQLKFRVALLIICKRPLVTNGTHDYTKCNTKGNCKRMYM